MSFWTPSTWSGDSLISSLDSGWRKYEFGQDRVVEFEFCRTPRTWSGDSLISSLDSAWRKFKFGRDRETRGEFVLSHVRRETGTQK